jgi:hypothetical protein
LREGEVSNATARVGSRNRLMNDGRRLRWEDTVSV